MKKIALIINDLSVGGAEIQLYHLVRMINSKHDLVVISLISTGELGEKMKSLGVKVVSIGFSVNKTFGLGFYRLCRLLLDYNPDIVHTWMYHSNFIAGIAAKLTGVKKIIWSIHHNDLTHKHNSKSLLLVAKLSAFLSIIIPNTIICVSEKVKFTHISYGYCSARMLVIPNGVDIKEFNYIDNARSRVLKELKLENDALLIGFFCRFDSIKDHRGFIAAVALLKEDYLDRNIQILMAGEGINHENTELTEMIRSSNLEPFVHLLDVRSDMPILMSSLDLFVNASFNESFSLVLAEALACNAMAVSSVEGDPSHIIKGVGEYFSAGQPFQMKEAMKKLLSVTPDIQIDKIKKGRERIVSTYSLTSMVENYDRLYLE